jgi:hypothetical protein
MGLAVPRTVAAVPEWADLAVVVLRHRSPTLPNQAVQAVQALFVFGSTHNAVCIDKPINQYC